MFFTVRAACRGTDLFVREVEHLRRAMRHTLTRHPFEILEIVVLGDVIHTVWRLPEDSQNALLRWRMIKQVFSRSVRMSDVAGQVTGAIWRRGLWSHPIHDDAELSKKRNMIFMAPVEAGLVKRPQEWAYSSVHRAAAAGACLKKLHLGQVEMVPKARRSNAPRATIEAHVAS